MWHLLKIVTCIKFLQWGITVCLDLTLTCPWAAHYESPFVACEYVQVHLSGHAEHEFNNTKRRKRRHRAPSSDSLSPEHVNTCSYVKCYEQDCSANFCKLSNTKQRQMCRSIDQPNVHIHRKLTTLASFSLRQSSKSCELPAFVRGMISE